MIDILRNFFHPATARRSEQAIRVNTAAVETAAEIRLRLNPNSIALALGAAAFLLILTSCALLWADYRTGYNSALIHKLVKLFYVDLEQNVPAFFSMSMMLFAALLLAVIAFFERKQKARHASEWALLAAGFLLMAFDEIVAVHERLIEPMRLILGGDHHQHLGFLYFAWVVPAGALVLLLALVFLEFLLSLPLKTRLFFVLAGTLFVGAAVGLELVEGYHAEIYGKENLTYMTLTTAEEGLEMSGVIILVRALLGYIGGKYKEMKLSFDAGEMRQARLK